MRAFVAVVVAMFASSVVVAAEPDSESLAVIRVVLTRAVNDALVNWESDRIDREFVISDRTEGCALPASACETARIRRASERMLTGEDVPDEELWPRPACPDEDLVTSNGSLVSRELVLRCLRTQPELKLQPMVLPVDARISFESEQTIRELFRRDREAWERLHPGAEGVVRVSTPVLSKDRRSAIVGFSRFRAGLGGGQFVAYLEKFNEHWEFLWQEMTLLE